MIAIGVIWVLVFVVAGIALYMNNTNINLAESMVYHPFNGSYEFGTNGQPLNKPLIKGDGTSQIMCPAGKKIKIFSAYTNVYDPNGICLAPNDMVTAKCQKSGLCTSADVECSNMKPNFTNIACDSCKYRDSTYTLSKMCDGQNICNATVTKDFFGEYPCNFSADEYAVQHQNTTNPCNSTSNYYKLPVTGSTNNIRQGYVVHGLYTCE